jgi:hypothetical protein
MAFNEVVAALTITAALALGVSAMQPDTMLAVPVASPVTITTTPLPLNRDDPAADRIGALQFMGAVQLRSTNALFGGVSALRFGGTTATGAQMLSITDTGKWLAFETVETAGRLSGIRNAQLVTIRQPDGSLTQTKAQGDAEALEWDAATGEATLVYEQDHRLAHFSGIDARQPATLAAAPFRIERLTAMTGWPPNGGGEAMAILPDGTRIVISERSLHADGSHAALMTRAGKTTEFGIMGLPDYSPTDAAALDATHILVLHRRFDLMGQGAAVSVVDLAPALTATPPRVLPTRLLAAWQPPVTLDNMEGLAVRREGSRTYLYIVSDDNLSGLQRTLLMKFRLLYP